MNYLNINQGVELAEVIGDLSVIFTMKSGIGAVDGYGKPNISNWLQPIVEVFIFGKGLGLASRCFKHFIFWLYGLVPVTCLL